MLIDHFIMFIIYRVRIIFQNNLNELWALFTYISDGKMFPSLTTFRKHIGVPIERGEKLEDLPEWEGK